MGRSDPETGCPNPYFDFKKLSKSDKIRNKLRYYNLFEKEILNIKKKRPKLQRGGEVLKSWDDVPRLAVFLYFGTLPK